MRPSSTNVPFSTGTLLPIPLLAKIDRGITALEVNYGLKGKLDYVIEYTEKAWHYTLTNNETTKDLVTMTNKSFAGINKFLVECGRVIAKTYAVEQTPAMAKRKSA